MYQNLKNTIFNILLFCFGIGLFLFNKLDSFALNQANVHCYDGGATNSYYRVANVSFDYDSSLRYCFLKLEDSNNASRYQLYSNSYTGITLRVYSLGYYWNTHERYPAYDQDRTGYAFFNHVTVSDGVFADGTSLDYATFLGYPPFDVEFETNLPVFTSQADAINYIVSGSMPVPDFDETLQLDSFKVTSWAIGNIQALFNSKFDVTWSDSRISTVQVRILGTANTATYESSSSPFKGKFKASNFVFNRGDVIHLVATPYKANGSYGQSLYYSVSYTDDIPFSNNYRKLVNNNVNDNTLTIPYIDTSGNNDNVTVPVDGVSTNVTYKVNYNPVTNEYGDLNVYEIYYSPVVVYPDETTENEIDETQNVVINNYNTTNYYETVQNIDTNFDIDLTDVSSGDIQNTYDDFGNFFKGFGNFVGKLALLFNGLFPFLSPTVSVVLVTMVGIIVVGAVVILFLKIFHII